MHIMPFQGWQREKGIGTRQPEANGRDCEMQHNIIKLKRLGVHEASYIMIALITTLIHDGTYHREKAGKMAVFGK